jgi:CCR4-NOT transcription complex subunit 6
MAWHYRKRNLLKELLTHRPDIMCLQEVQSDHFTEFLQPELTKAGYMGIYKKKTTEIFTGSAYTIDGCATFFKQERFHLVKKYEVEFNKAAISLADQMTNAQQKKATMNRLLKVGRLSLTSCSTFCCCFGWRARSGRRGRTTCDYYSCKVFDLAGCLVLQLAGILPGGCARTVTSCSVACFALW